MNYLFTESDTVATLFSLSREQSQNLPFVTFLRNQLLRFGLTVLPFFFCHHDESFFSLCDIIFAVELFLCLCDIVFAVELFLCLCDIAFAVELFLCLCDIAFAMELFLSLCGVVQHAWMVSECCVLCVQLNLKPVNLSATATKVERFIEKVRLLPLCSSHRLTHRETQAETVINRQGK